MAAGVAVKKAKSPAVRTDGVAFQLMVYACKGEWSVRLPTRKQLYPPTVAEQLRAWLAGRAAATGCTRVPIRTAMQNGPHGARRVERLDAALRELSANGEVVVFRLGQRRWIDVRLPVQRRVAARQTTPEQMRRSPAATYLESLSG